jgi:hypothetical protein
MAKKVPKSSKKFKKKNVLTRVVYVTFFDLKKTKACTSLKAGSRNEVVRS